MKKVTKAQKQKIRQFFSITVVSFGIAVIVLVVLIQIFSMVANKIKKDKPVEKIDFESIEVEKPKIKKKFLTVNVNSRPGESLEGVNGIVIHYTANPGTDALANRNYFESRKDMPDEMQYKVSSHFIIGLDGKIIQCIPLNEIAYASNERNIDTISIECCHPDASGEFSDKTYNSLIELCSWLCDKYEIEQSEIIRHYDVTGKMCPLYYVEHEKAWKTLKSDIWNRVLKSEKIS